MLISQVLRRKGSDVATIEPGASVTTVLASLAEHGVGALVVSGDGRAVDGIVSERDIVRAMAHHGADTLDMTAAELMTAEVVTCSPDASIDQLMAAMTERRFRHVPVTEDHVLVGIVSIGDVVNARVRELETETEQLTNYISGR
ncbi:MAG: CBS domain-containing protein [Actinobacteria bacterium]|nr:CBS domain-containing protein [Actinomycetota bacterium]NIS29136.1 CBS domain-containing protein [Actinomycetota bacterium]NIT94365.1 CBS domain-containing protein [Actinomycetota bacterium]NIU17971.1 CBS domain-containing protein [Actinomycetota bacterium]NIU64536.1 CBS domain-containing protein [Actinomycetota bacterium]